MRTPGERIPQRRTTVARRADRPLRQQLRATDKMKEPIDRHMFEIAIQAAIGAKVIARSTVTARRKNETAKSYGGDAKRKRNLLEKQKEEKKRIVRVVDSSGETSSCLSH